MVVLVVLSIICAASIAFAGENISDIWKEVSGASHLTNIQLTYAQIESIVYAIGYVELDGVPCIWHGTGTINGNTAEYLEIYSMP